MAFHWYLDIEEVTGDEYSIGPIVFSNDETLTLTEFLTRINLACSVAYTTGVSGTNRYQVLARVAPMPEAPSGNGPEAPSRFSKRWVQHTRSAHWMHDNCSYNIKSCERWEVPVLKLSLVQGLMGFRSCWKRLPGGLTGRT